MPILEMQPASDWVNSSLDWNFQMLFSFNVAFVNRAIAESERRKAAVLVLQSFARTLMVMRDLRIQHEAATVIQATWRSILGLAFFLLMLGSAILIQGLACWQALATSSAFSLEAGK
jgi:hypothetical protein